MAMPSEEVQDIVYAMQRENERIQSARTHSEMSEEKADDYFAVNRFFLINSFFRINQAFCVCFTCNHIKTEQPMVLSVYKSFMRSYDLALDSRLLDS